MTGVTECFESAEPRWTEAYDFWPECPELPGLPHGLMAGDLGHCYRCGAELFWPLHECGSPLHRLRQADCHRHGEWPYLCTGPTKQCLQLEDHELDPWDWAPFFPGYHCQSFILVRLHELYLDLSPSTPAAEALRRLRERWPHLCYG